MSVRLAPGLAVLGLVTALAGPAAAQTLAERRQALAHLNAREQALESQIGANRNQLARLLGALQLFSRDAPPPLLVSPGDAKDAVRAMILARAIAPALEARARALQAQAEALAQTRRQVAEASGALFAAESALEDRQGRLQALAQDAGAMAPPAARQAAGGLDAQPAPSVLAAPVGGAPATRYGGRLASGALAQGLAWRPAAGAPVLSPAAGVVAYAGPLNGWGEVVILRAGGGCHMVLAGLGKVAVAAGQSVASSAPLGSMPAGGHPPPELYLEVRMGGEPIDPARMLSAPAAAQAARPIGRRNTGASG